MDLIYIYLLDIAPKIGLFFTILGTMSFVFFGFLFSFNISSLDEKRKENKFLGTMTLIGFIFLTIGILMPSEKALESMFKASQTQQNLYE